MLNKYHIAALVMFPVLFTVLGWYLMPGAPFLLKPIIGFFGVLMFAVPMVLGAIVTYVFHRLIEFMKHN